MKKWHPVACRALSLPLASALDPDRNGESQQQELMELAEPFIWLRHLPLPARGSVFKPLERG